VLAVAVALLAHDVGAWGAAIRQGDDTTPAAAGAGRWRPSTVLPRSLSGRLLEVDDDVALREAIRAFAIAVHTPRGFDNGRARADVRARAEAALSDVAARAAPAAASQADDLLGVLAGSGGRIIGGVPPEDRSRGYFEEAVRLFPANTDAAYNLELVLRRERAVGIRRGPSQGSGPRGTARGGAGASAPGRGY
jgi:hypothetical protein